MTYSVGGKVQASDYNGFVSNNSNNINQAWGTGSGSSGYGQPQFTPVAIGELIKSRATTVTPGNPNNNVPPTWSATPEWRALVDSANAMSRHQTGANAVSAASFSASNNFPSPTPATGGLVAFSTALNSALTTVTGNQRLNASAQGTIITTALTNNVGTWSNNLKFTFNVDFGNANRLRYFFNAGGQVRFSMSHGGSSQIDNLFSNIATEAGQIYLSSTNLFPLTIAGQTYNGVTKVGGVTSSDPSRTNIFNAGFYQLTSTPLTILTQTGSSPSMSQTAASFISITAAQNGAGKLTFVVTWDEVPDGFSVSSGSITNMSLLPPSTANIVDTWGTPTITTNVEVAQGAQCATPSVGTVSPNSFQATIPYTGTITVTNATLASIVSGTLPTGISVSSAAASGTNYVISLSGTPSTSGQIYDIRVNATNAAIGCAESSAQNQQAGSGTVVASLCPAPVPNFSIPGSAFQADVTFSSTGAFVANATSATLTGLPTGIIVTGSQSGANYAFNISGKPDISTAGQTWTARVTATNDCGGGKTASTITDVIVGTGTVGSLANCVTPSVGAITPNSFQVGVAYNGTITIQNATSASLDLINNKSPTGITMAGQPSGANYVFTVTGTPTVANETYDFRLTATNSGANCTTVSLPAPVSAGSGTVSGAAACPAPSVGTMAPTVLKPGVAYTGTITIIGATSATVTGLPLGISAVSSSFSGGNVTINLAGTPTLAAANQSYTPSVTATNDCGGGKTATTVTANAGTVTVQSADTCPAPTYGTVVEN